MLAEIPNQTLYENECTSPFPPATPLGGFVTGPVMEAPHHLGSVLEVPQNQPCFAPAALVHHPPAVHPMLHQSLYNNMPGHYRYAPAQDFDVFCAVPHTLAMINNNPHGRMMACASVQPYTVTVDQPPRKKQRAESLRVPEVSLSSQPSGMTEVQQQQADLVERLHLEGCRHVTQTFPSGMICKVLKCTDLPFSDWLQQQQKISLAQTTCTPHVRVRRPKRLAKGLRWQDEEIGKSLCVVQEYLVGDPPSMLLEPESDEIDPIAEQTKSALAPVVT